MIYIRESSIEYHLNLFINALDNVSEEYYLQKSRLKSQLAHLVDYCSYHNKEINEEKVFTILKEHNERVYAYELYHQLRKIIEVYPLPQDVALQAELHKMVMNELIENYSGLKSLGNEYSPDFLIHSPGRSENQDLVVELKTNPNINAQAIADDLDKIIKFVDNYFYEIGFMIIIGSDWSINNFKKSKLLFEKYHKLDNKLKSRIFIINKIEYSSEIEIYPIGKVYNILSYRSYSYKNAKEWFREYQLKLQSENFEKIKKELTDLNNNTDLVALDNTRLAKISEIERLNRNNDNLLTKLRNHKSELEKQKKIYTEMSVFIKKFGRKTNEVKSVKTLLKKISHLEQLLFISQDGTHPITFFEEELLSLNFAENDFPSIVTLTKVLDKISSCDKFDNETKLLLIDKYNKLIKNAKI